MTDKETLETFLSCDLATGKEVFEKFAVLDRAKYYTGSQSFENFVYIPGTREDRVLLIAHADTVFIRGNTKNHKIGYSDGKYFSLEPGVGIGADDRAGCAIVYLLKDLGHSILILDGEELGSAGAIRLRLNYPELFNELNSHQYMLEFDRGYADNYKTYLLPVTEDFINFIECNYYYKRADYLSMTDITILCSTICGANLSVGYYRWHTPKEYLVYEEWKKTLNLSRKILSVKQRKFEMDDEYSKELMKLLSELV